MATITLALNVGTGGDVEFDAAQSQDSFHVTATGNGYFTIALGAGNDTVTSSGQQDWLYGGAGNDSMTIKVGVAEGQAGNDTITGDTRSALGVTLSGDAGNDMLIGYADMTPTAPGAAAPMNKSRLSGGKGDDTYVLRSDFHWVEAEERDEMENGVYVTPDGHDRVVLTYFDDTTFTLGKGIEVLEVITNATRAGAGGFVGWINANDLDNHISIKDAPDSDARAAIVFGYDGNDTMVGSSGRDRFAGGEGNDRLFGQGGNDNLTGDTGADTLDGGTGADTMNGGADNDVYVVDDVGDAVTDSVPGGGYGGVDRVDTTLWTYTLGATIENLSYIGTGAFTGQGNGSANVINGGAMNDALHGHGGNDQLLGHGGNDVLRGGTGNDTVNGGAGNDNLFGDAGNDQLVGGDGNDIMRGGAGRDTITGGAGVDRLILTALSDSATGNADIFTDFKTGIDKVDLSAIDANTTTAANDAFVFAGLLASDPMFTSAGDLWARATIYGIELRGDVNGDGIYDLSVFLQSSATVLATDLVL
jgi:Ca2+-binding RTX toxin-like protein